MSESKPASLTARDAPAQTAAVAALLRDADLCVKCGLCLPQCPTYGVSQNEADSPRGRIALAQGLFSGAIEPSARMEAHLDGCLSCRRCESVCPARVPYGRLLDASRAELSKRRPARKRAPRLLGLFLSYRMGRGSLRLGLSAYRVMGLQFLVRRFGLLGAGALARLESLLPIRQARPSLPTPTQGAQPDQGRIALFAGCAGDLFESEALEATSRLLQAAGYEVSVPPGQGCCGALHQHGGMPQQAARLAARNVSAFAEFERIAVNATGCGASLQDYADLTPSGDELATKVADFSQWLEPLLDRLEFKSCNAVVALHTPCTARNVMASDQALRRLLQKLPGIRLVDIGQGAHCCGAAGSHFITQPEASDQLLESRLEEIARLQPDVILSGNVGCSLHMAGGLRRRAWSADSSLRRISDASVPVLHPAVFLAQRLVAAPLRP